MTAEQRVLEAMHLSDLTCEMFRQGLRKRFPDLSESELHALYLARLEKCHNSNY